MPNVQGLKLSWTHFNILYKSCLNMRLKLWGAQCDTCLSPLRPELEMERMIVAYEGELVSHYLEILPHNHLAQSFTLTRATSHDCSSLHPGTVVLLAIHTALQLSLLVGRV